MERRQRKKQPQSYDFAFIKQMWSDLHSLLWFAQARQRWSQLPRFHRHALSILIPFTVLLMVVPFPSSLEKAQNVDDSDMGSRREVSLNVTTGSKAPKASTFEPTPKVTKETRTQETSRALVQSAWVSYTVKQGDTLARIFRERKLSSSDLAALIAIEGSDRPLSDIRPGQLVRYRLNDNGQLDMLQLEKGSKSIMFFRLSKGGFSRGQ
ncbi:LysM-like peptidoglycan-binding domain-containing protein [Vibrio sp. WJH972]